MSLNLQLSIPRRAVRFLQLWPLLLFLLLLLWGGMLAIEYWPELLLKSNGWQRTLNQQLSERLLEVREHPQQAGILLIVFSLLYGILHAVGPGHGKVVITTYLATHPSRLRDSLRLTLLASLLQGGVAVVLVTLFLVVLQLSSRQLYQGAFWLEKGSFILLMLLGLWLIYRALKRLLPVLRAARPRALVIQRLQPLDEHVHDAHCGCGHRHLPSDEELQAGSDWRTRLAIILAMGLRPCTGAILVLLFAKVVGVYLWGVAAAFAMALGTSLTISLLALLVHGARHIAVRLGRQSPSATWRAVAWSSLALAGGVALLFSGVLLYLSIQPEMMGGIRPFSR